METFKIQAIMSAYKHKSLSKAAEEFSYTPSAFSHMLTSFEEELGVKIFKRTSKGVELTPEGNVLIKNFEKILSCESELLKTASAFRSNYENEIKIASYSSISRTFLTDLIKKFRKENPEIKLTVEVVDDIIGYMAKNKADILFGINLIDKDYETVSFLSDEYLLVGIKELLKGKKEISRDELYSYPVIFTDDEGWRECFDKKKFTEMFYFRSEDDLSIIKILKEGMGVTLLSKLMLKSANVGLSTCKIVPKIVREVCFAYRKDKKNTYALSKFIKSFKNLKF